jgi:DNA-binding response OmpR family regulator
MKETHNVRLLVVEDDSDYLTRILTRLKRYGYADPDTASTEDEALHSLANNYYDVIVSDMRLGNNGSGGFVVIDEVQRRNITSVVIILTANDTLADCHKALRAGRGWDYISKTKSEGSALDELHESIKEALARLNRWGNRHDEVWIQDNLDGLREKYPNQFIAVINNTVIESAETEVEIKQLLAERRLPLFLPVIRKVEIALPHGIPVIELIRRDASAPEEGRHLEFKSTLLWDINLEKKNEDLRLVVLKTIVAFLNTEGGTLLIGVKDDGNIYGIEKDFEYANSSKRNRDGFELHLWDVIGTQIGRAFSAYIKFRFEFIDDKTVCAVDVLKSPEPAFLPGKRDKNIREFYIRSGNNSRELDAEQMYKHLRMKKWV